MIVTNHLENIFHKKNYMKVCVLSGLLFVIIIICFTYGTIVRHEKIKGGVYFGIMLGMEKGEVKDRLRIRAKGLDKISYKDADNKYILQNHHLLNDHNFYVDESYLFEEKKLIDIFITIKCLDTSLVNKMQKDIIEKLVELYGNYEVVNDLQTWKKGDARIILINDHPTKQFINVLISETR